MKPFKTLAIILIMIGTIGIALNMIFGSDSVSYLSVDYVNNIKFYKYDFASYISNLRATLSQTTQLNLQTNPRTWQDGSTLTWTALINDLAFILNYIIFAINILIYPFRIGGYILQNTWAILGLNSNMSGQNPIYWLWILSRVMTGLQIPMI